MSRPFQSWYDKCADAYGEERIFERISEGEQVRAIQQDIWDFMVEQGWEAENPRSHEPRTTFSRQCLYSWIKRGPKDPQTGIGLRQQRFNEMRVLSGATFADKALEKLESATPANISVVREQVKGYQWHAAKADPEQYGEKQQSVQINIGAMHLDALRQRQVIDVKVPKALPAEDDGPDYELEESDAETDA